LWWVDIHGQALRRWDGRQMDTAPLPAQAGSIALRRDGGMRVALAGGVYLLGTHEPELLVRPAEHDAALRFNDGRCDRAGRFWVGTLKEPSLEPVGILYRIDAHGRATAMRAGIQVPNSIAWSPDGNTMYSPTARGTRSGHSIPTPTAARCATSASSPRRIP